MSDNPRIPLVAPIGSRDFTTVQDAKMVNCFVEQVGTSLAAVKRPGLSISFQGKVGCGQGVVNFLENLYSVSGDTLTSTAVTTFTYTQTTPAAGWSPRTGMMGVGFNGKLWAMGGGNASANFNDVYNSTDGINWTLITAAAAWPARLNASLVVLGGAMYVMGGTTFLGVYLSDVWSSTDGITWTLLSTGQWPGRSLFGATIFENAIWIAGGQASATTALNDVWSSPNGVSWVRATGSAPWVPRSRFGFTGFGGRLRVLAGGLSSFPGAGGDLWSSADGVSWTRDSSNPFSQAGTGVFAGVALTSNGAELALPVVATLSGGGGAGAIATMYIDDTDDQGDDSGPGIASTSITTTGAGYTSAPAITYATNGAGIPPSAYTFLAANGTAGDKRGVIVNTGSILFFFTTLNNGSLSSPNQIWSSTDGVAWILTGGSLAYSPRDMTPFVLGNLWVLSGQNSGGFLSDVWKSPLTSSSSIALTPTVTCLPFSFSQTSSVVTNPLLFFKTNKDAYIWNANLSLLTKVSNANYPATTVPGIAYLDGYFFVMDPQGRIWNSAVQDPLTWTALGVIPMQSEPNGGVALSKAANYVVALGVWSMQFFFDAAVAAPASPLQVNDTLTSLTGCASGDSLVEMQGSFVWIGQNKKEGRGVFALVNLTPQRISDPFIDRILEADTLTNVRAFVTVAKGHSLYVLTLVNSNITLVYDFLTKAWAVWTSRAPSVAVLVTSLSSNAYGLVTVTAPFHGLSDGDSATIAGASVGGYNGTFNVSFVDVNTVTYLVPAQLASNPGTASMTGSTEGYFIGRGSASQGGRYLIQDELNGSVYQFGPTTYTDNGNPIDVRLLTFLWDGDTMHYKTFPNTTIVGDINQGSLLLRYTNDDYSTFSSYRAINMRFVRQHLTRNGRGRRRAWQVRHTGATPFRVFYLEFSPEGGDF